MSTTEMTIRLLMSTAAFVWLPFAGHAAIRACDYERACGPSPAIVVSSMPSRAIAPLSCPLMASAPDADGHLWIESIDGLNWLAWVSGVEFLARGAAGVWVVLRYGRLAGAATVVLSWLLPAIGHLLLSDWSSDADGYLSVDGWMSKPVILLMTGLFAGVLAALAFPRRPDCRPRPTVAYRVVERGRG